MSRQLANFHRKRWNLDDYLAAPYKARAVCSRLFRDGAREMFQPDLREHLETVTKAEDAVRREVRR